MVTDTKIIKRFEQAQDSLVLQSSDLSLETIAKMVETSAIDVAPRYQRRERWSLQAQAELIESFLLNVPVPPVYLAEDDFGTYSVIDGKQRITAISTYLRNGFALTGLTSFTELDHLEFRELPKPLQNALSIRPYLRVVTLLKQTNPELKYEVFTRLNTGGQPLLAQEIRNALYRGKFNDLLFELGLTPFLRQQLKISTETESAFREMMDVEMVLRFFTFNESWQAFNGDSRRSMDDYMSRHRKASGASLAKFRSQFLTALSRCEALWGDVAFKRYAGSAFRDQFLAAIYDAEMIAVATLTQKRFDELRAQRSAVVAATKRLFASARFEESVRAATNTPSRVRYRVEKMKELLASV